MHCLNGRLLVALGKLLNCVSTCWYDVMQSLDHGYSESQAVILQVLGVGGGVVG